MNKNLIAILAALAIAAPVVRAQSAAFTYQGILKDETGQSLPEQNQIVTFKLYKMPTGDEFLWGRTYAVKLDTNGLFNVEISDASGSAVEGGLHSNLKEAIADAANGSLFIGLTVTGMGGEIQPRQKILPVPYAIMAADVSSATGNFTVGGRLEAVDVTVNNELNVQRKANLQTLNVAGTSDLTGKLKALGGIEMTGGKAKFVGDFSVNGAAAFKGDLCVTGGNVDVVNGKVKEGGNDLIPKGVIVMWSGNISEIPAGWALCDGNGGRPDLRDRFIVGAGKDYTVKQIGGEAYHALTIDEMPAHTHTTPFYNGYYVSFWVNSGEIMTNKKNDDGVTNRRSNEVGGSQPHENRPPYYALCFIIKL